MTRLNPKPSAGPVQPVRHAPARPYIVVGSAVIAAVLLIIVVLNIRSAPAPQQQNAATTPTDIEVFSPGKLTDEDLAATDMQQIERDPRLSLPEGGRIQATDEQGRLAQQYSFTRLDPDPPGQPAGWVMMENPVAEIYVADDRVLRLEGKQALAHVPKRALESGTMTGEVLIRVYEITPGQIVNTETQAPSLIVRTMEASFDNIVGEVRCPNHVHVETPDAEFKGQNLQMLINDSEQLVQSMTVERGDFIRIAAAASDVSSGGSPNSPAASRTQPTPNASQSAAPQPDASDLATPSAEKPAQFYELTLHDNVRIEQGRGPDARTLNGDSLTVTFSFRSKGLGSAMAFRPTPRDVSPRRFASDQHGPPSLVMLSMPSRIAAASIAIAPDATHKGSIAPPISVDDVMVYWDGPLTMTPVTDPAKRLASESDARLELFGSPLTLTDTDNWTTVTCASLAYHTQAQNPILLASAAHPGVLVRQDPTHAEVQSPGITPQVELSITWGKALELDFYDSPDGEGSGSIKRAIFTRDVEVLTPDLNLTAQNMRVGFFPGEGQRSAIETILATEEVIAHRPGPTPEEDSQLKARELLVEFALNAEQKSYPRHVRATGDIEARDAAQTMWADVVDVLLRERTAEEQAQLRSAATANDTEANSATTPGLAGLEWGDDRMGATELEKLTAESDVQLLLEGGSRVWADKLEVGGEDRTVTLTGDNVIVAHENFLLDKGKHIRLDDIRRSGRMEGPGQFRQFDRPIVPTEAGKLPKPVIELPSQARVRWTERMDYDEQFDQGNSAIEFHGQVEGSSQPNALELSTVSADRLRFEFEREAAASETHAAPAPPQPDSNDVSLADNRRIRRLFAAGDARIESRSWEQQDRSDTPRVFYITGDAIDYDEEKLDAAVTGKGSLLIRDERQPKDAAAPTVVVGPGNTPPPMEVESFGARGTTLFRFTEGMRMTKQIEDRYLATFTGNVEWLHKSLNGQTATLTGQHLEAVISRRGEAVEQVDLDFGGPAELERLHGKGAVFIRTATRDVQCEEFTYDPSTGIAEIAALPGRTASVLTKGSPQPFHAERMIWNMNEDKITIMHGSLNR